MGELWSALIPDSLFIRRGETPVAMRGGAREARAEFALLSRFCAAGGATKFERFILLGLHSYTMNRRLQIEWSIVTSPQTYLR
jgi:hypothetical protein